MISLKNIASSRHRIIVVVLLFLVFLLLAQGASATNVSVADWSVYENGVKVFPIVMWNLCTDQNASESSRCSNNVANFTNLTYSLGGNSVFSTDITTINNIIIPQAGS